MDLRIRQAELDREEDALLELQRAAYATEARLIGVDSLPVAPLAGEDVWVADLDGAPVGVVGIEPGAEPLIARLAVHPDHARRGIGRALAEHAVALGAVRVGTAAANEPAIKLYESLGFEQVGERTVGDGLPFVDLRQPARRTA